MVIFGYMEKRIIAHPLEEFFYGCMSIGLILPWLDSENRIIVNQLTKSGQSNMSDEDITIDSLTVVNVNSDPELRVTIQKKVGNEIKSILCLTAEHSIDFMRSNLSSDEERSVIWDVKHFAIGSGGVVHFFRAVNRFTSEESLELNHRSKIHFEEYVFISLIDVFSRSSNFFINSIYNYI